MPRLVLVSAPVGFGVEALLVRSLAQRARGDLDAALADLGRSLRAAVPEGYGRLLVDEGPAVRELLRTLASRLDLPGSPEAAALLQAAGAQHDRGTARLATVDRAGPAQQARGRGAATAGDRPDRSADRRPAVHVGQHLPDAHPAHLHHA